MGGVGWAVEMEEDVGDLIKNPRWRLRWAASSHDGSWYATAAAA